MMAHVLRAVLVAAASFLTYKILGLLFEVAKHYLKGQGNITDNKNEQNIEFIEFKEDNENKENNGDNTDN